MAQLSDVWKREEKVKDRIDKHRRLPSDKIYTRHAKGYHPPPEDPKPNPRNRTKKKKGKKRQDETVPFTIKQLKEMDAEKLKKVYRRYAKNKEDEILNYDDINAMFLEASDDELENLGMFQRKPGEKKWLPPTTYEIPGFYLHDDKYISRTEDLVMLAFNDENDNWLTMHYKSPFVIDGLKFNTVYQYAFFKKVERFTNDRDQMFYVLICDDSKTLSKMNLNLNRSYKTEEVYGFTARNLSLKYWNALHSIDLYKATYAKFKQNDILKQKLLSTGNQLLIQCDGIANGYGCGYFISRRGVANRGWRFPSSWMGKNLYGFILMDVREQIKIEEDDAYEGLKLTYELNKNFSWEVTRWDNPDDNSPFSPEYDGKKTLGVKQDDKDS